MLYHRSGLHDYTINTNFHQWKDKPEKRAELLREVAGKGADFEPGTRSEYSNSNYLLLGHIVEEICKIPYGKVIATRITSKIGLKNTAMEARLISTTMQQFLTNTPMVNGRWKKPRTRAFMKVRVRWFPHSCL